MVIVFFGWLLKEVLNIKLRGVEWMFVEIFEFLNLLD